MTDSAGPPATAPARILLVVDDEPELGAMFRRFLKRSFAEIHEAESAEKAAALLASTPVTHLIVDASLPDCTSGETLATKWRGEHPGLRFVALFSGSASLRDAQIPGVDRVFIKPDGFDELVQALKA